MLATFTSTPPSLSLCSIASSSSTGSLKSLVNRFHLLVLVVWQLSTFFSTQTLFPIFSNYTPQWRCFTQNNATNAKIFMSIQSAFLVPSQISSTDSHAYTVWSHNCEVWRRCEEMEEFAILEFQPKSFYGAAVEFDWVCDTENCGKALQRLYSQLQFVGMLVGMALFSTISDALGRKWVSMVALAGGAASIAASGLATNATQLLSARFFVGLFIGSKVALFTLLTELISPELRLPLKAIANWGNARLLLTLVCFLFRDWRQASFVSAALIAPSFLIVLLLLPESPTWLRNTNRLEAAHKCETRIAKLAGDTPADDTLIKHHCVVASAEANQNFLTLLRNPILFKRVSILWVMWTCAGLSSYTLDFSSGQISGNLFVNQVFMSLLISISKLTMCLIDRRCPNFSRRNLHQWSQSIVVACFVLLALIVATCGEKSPLIVVVYCIGIMFLEFTWDACTLCAIESVPTPLRSTALASCSTMSRFGAILAPVVLTLSERWPTAPYLVLCGVGSLSLLISYLCLIDTKNVDLARVRLHSIKAGHRKKEKDTTLESLVNIAVNPFSRMEEKGNFGKE